MSRFSRGLLRCEKCLSDSLNIACSTDDKYLYNSYAVACASCGERVRLIKVSYRYDEIINQRDKSKDSGESMRDARDAAMGYSMALLRELE